MASGPPDPDDECALAPGGPLFVPLASPLPRVSASSLVLGLEDGRRFFVALASRPEEPLARQPRAASRGPLAAAAVLLREEHLRAFVVGVEDDTMGTAKEEIEGAGEESKQRTFESEPSPSAVSSPSRKRAAPPAPSSSRRRKSSRGRGGETAPPQRGPPCGIRVVLRFTLLAFRRGERALRLACGIGAPASGKRHETDEREGGCAADPVVVSSDVASDAPSMQDEYVAMDDVIGEATRVLVEHWLEEQQAAGARRGGDEARKSSQQDAKKAPRGNEQQKRNGEEERGKKEEREDGAERVGKGQLGDEEERDKQNDTGKASGGVTKIGSGKGTRHVAGTPDGGAKGGAQRSASGASSEDEALKKRLSPHRLSFPLVTPSPNAPDPLGLDGLSAQIHPHSSSSTSVSPPASWYLNPRDRVFACMHHGDWTDDAPDPPGLRSHLFRYQQRCLAWMLWREGRRSAPPGARATRADVGARVLGVAVQIDLPQIDQSWPETGPDGSGPSGPLQVEELAPLRSPPSSQALPSPAARAATLPLGRSNRVLFDAVIGAVADASLPGTSERERLARALEERERTAGTMTLGQGRPEKAKSSPNVLAPPSSPPRCVLDAPSSSHSLASCPLPLGGLLCDEMGLGKTVEMIALILANPRPRTEVVCWNGTLTHGNGDNDAGNEKVDGDKGASRPAASVAATAAAKDEAGPTATSEAHPSSTAFPNGSSGLSGTPSILAASSTALLGDVKLEASTPLMASPSRVIKRERAAPAPAPASFATPPAPIATFPRLIPGGTLVVCPPALVQQWRSELNNHAGGALAVEVYDGLAELEGFGPSPGAENDPTAWKPPGQRRRGHGSSGGGSGSRAGAHQRAAEGGAENGREDVGGGAREPLTPGTATARSPGGAASRVPSSRPLRPGRSRSSTAATPGPGRRSAAASAPGSSRRTSSRPPLRLPPSVVAEQELAMRIAAGLPLGGASAEDVEATARGLARRLAAADVVVVSLGVLRAEAHFSPEASASRSLRREKRYAVPTCPLLLVDWWRTVVDEAQAVGPFSAAASVLACCRAERRWAVTGTPLGGSRELEDCGALLGAVGAVPLGDAVAFRRAVLAPLAARLRPDLAWRLLSRSLAPLSWRCDKKQVALEQPLPPRSLELVPLRFTAGEREFYALLLEQSRRARLEVRRVREEQVEKERKRAQGMEDKKQRAEREKRARDQKEREERRNDDAAASEDETAQKKSKWEGKGQRTEEATRSADAASVFTGPGDAKPAPPPASVAGAKPVTLTTNPPESSPAAATPAATTTAEPSSSMPALGAASPASTALSTAALPSSSSHPRVPLAPRRGRRSELARAMEEETTSALQLRLACIHPQLTRHWKRLSGDLQLGAGGTLSMAEIMGRLADGAAQDLQALERAYCAVANTYAHVCREKADSKAAGKGGSKAHGQVGSVGKAEHAGKGGESNGAHDEKHGANGTARLIVSGAKDSGSVPASDANDSGSTPGPGAKPPAPSLSPRPPGLQGSSSPSSASPPSLASASTSSAALLERELLMEALSALESSFRVAEKGIGAIDLPTEKIWTLPDIPATSSSTVIAWKLLQLNTAVQLRAVRERLGDAKGVEAAVKDADDKRRYVRSGAELELSVARSKRQAAQDAASGAVEMAREAFAQASKLGWPSVGDGENEITSRAVPDDPIGPDLDVFLSRCTATRRAAAEEEALELSAQRESSSVAHMLGTRVARAIGEIEARVGTHVAALERRVLAEEVLAAAADLERRVDALKLAQKRVQDGDVSEGSSKAAQDAAEAIVRALWLLPEFVRRRLAVTWIDALPGDAAARLTASGGPRGREPSRNEARVQGKSISGEDGGNEDGDGTKKESDGAADWDTTRDAPSRPMSSSATRPPTAAKALVRARFLAKGRVPFIASEVWLGEIEGYVFTTRVPDRAEDQKCGASSSKGAIDDDTADASVGDRRSTCATSGQTGYHLDRPPVVAGELEPLRVLGCLQGVLRSLIEHAKRQDRAWAAAAGGRDDLEDVPWVPGRSRTAPLHADARQALEKLPSAAVGARAVGCRAVLTALRAWRDEHVASAQLRLREEQLEDVDASLRKAEVGAPDRHGSRESVLRRMAAAKQAAVEAASKRRFLLQKLHEAEEEEMGEEVAEELENGEALGGQGEAMEKQLAEQGDRESSEGKRRPPEFEVKSGREVAKSDENVNDAEKGSENKDDIAVSGSAAVAPSIDVAVPAATCPPHSALSLSSSAAASNPLPHHVSATVTTSASLQSLPAPLEPAAGLSAAQLKPAVTSLAAPLVPSAPPSAAPLPPSVPPPSDSDADECPICYIPLSIAGEAYVFGSCGHAFCADCAKQQVIGAGTCALCREKVTHKQVFRVAIAGHRRKKTHINKDGTSSKDNEALLLGAENTGDKKALTGLNVKHTEQTPPPAGAVASSDHPSAPDLSSNAFSFLGSLPMCPKRSRPRAPATDPSFDLLLFSPSVGGPLRFLPNGSIEVLPLSEGLDEAFAPSFASNQSSLGGALEIRHGSREVQSGADGSWPSQALSPHGPGEVPTPPLPSLLRTSLPRVRGEWSAKIAALVRRLLALSQLSPHEKSLVFSQHSAALQLVSLALKANGIKHASLGVGGRGTVAARDAVSAFRERDDVRVFLLSHRAGAAGLTLTRANHVFLLEPSLDPGLEQQAVARVHRVGQRRPVRIHRLVVRGSIEQAVLARAEAKALLVGKHAKIGGAGGAGGAAEAVRAGATPPRRSGNRRDSTTISPTLSLSDRVSAGASPPTSPLSFRGPRALDPEADEEAETEGEGGEATTLEAPAPKNERADFSEVEGLLDDVL